MTWKAALLCLMMFSPVVAKAQNTGFSYQGRLTAGGSNANTPHDFVFKLFTAQFPDGSQVGGDVVKDDVAIANGVFTVTLDFGSSPFTPAAANYLEVWVRPGASTGGYTQLLPRVEVARSPYSIATIHAEKADALSQVCVNCVTSGQIASVQGSQVTGNISGSQINGTIPIASVPAGNANYIQNTVTTQSGANFDISGSGHLGGGLRVEGSGSSADTAVGSFSSLGRFNIDAPFIPGGRVTVLNNGNVGIGTNNPVQKLDVMGTGVVRANVNSDSNAGLSISLGGLSRWSLAAVNPGHFQIFNQSLGSNALWIDNATNNIGAGVTNPAYRLDVGQRMRIRSGGNNAVSAGLWLNNNANSEAAFIGMEDDTHVGFFGSGTGWKFGMNTTNGALRLNGSEGQPGDVITSNGTGTPAQWRSSTNLLYQRTSMATGTGSIQPPEATSLPVPGLSQTISVSGNAKLFIQFSVMGSRGSCIGCVNAQASVEVYIDGARVQSIWEYIPPDSLQHIDGSWIENVGPGSHTIQINARTALGGVTFGCGGCNDKSTLIIQVIPE